MVDRQDNVISTIHHMEIGWTTNVQHITHVTFDRFNGFLVLPVEFDVEILGRFRCEVLRLLLFPFNSLIFQDFPLGSFCSSWV
ncbi:rho GTPase-activating protein 2 [Senna tora]|uniref:Rho GTPase-activating protein 2 n=1 Tax=Senna tora TaxID=362788 RepID=A0A835CHN6_9FABA|nr:rho GTPase-activating protein 2 [Senna tora]